MKRKIARADERGQLASGNREMMPNVTRMRPEVVQRAAYEPAMLVAQPLFRSIKPWLVGSPVRNAQRLCRVAFGRERLHVRSLELEQYCPLEVLLLNTVAVCREWKMSNPSVFMRVEPGKLFTREMRVRE